MAHRYHPDLDKGDKEDALYFDDCEDCKHHAEWTPYYLDSTKATALWNRMFAVEFDNENYRSENEKIACMELWKTYIFLERFTSLNPKSLFSWTRE